MRSSDKAASSASLLSLQVCVSLVEFEFEADDEQMTVVNCRESENKTLRASKSKSKFAFSPQHLIYHLRLTLPSSGLHRWTFLGATVAAAMREGYLKPCILEFRLILRRPNRPQSYLCRVLESA